jgi:hypothetical protein
MGLAMGLAKGVVGVAVRPLVAAVEACSKLLYALALATLGREGILGKMQVGGGWLAAVLVLGGRVGGWNGGPRGTRSGRSPGYSWFQALLLLCSVSLLACASWLQPHPVLFTHTHTRAAPRQGPRRLCRGRG